MAILDAGTYRAHAVEGALGETKAGREQVAVKFRLLEEGLPMSTITWYGYFTEKTTNSTFRALRDAGWRGQDVSDLSDLSREDAPEVDLVIEHEVGQDGVTRAKVRWVNGVGGVALGAQMSPDKAKVFAAKMRGKLAAFDKDSGASARAVAAQAPARPAGRPSNGAAEVPQEVLDAQAHEADSASDDIPF